jgi:hypothetical protein
MFDSSGEGRRGRQHSETGDGDADVTSHILYNVWRGQLVNINPIYGCRLVGDSAVLESVARGKKRSQWRCNALVLIG